MASPNLLESLSGLITPDVVASASKYLGEPSGATQQALGAALPAVLAGVTRVAQSGGGTALEGLLRTPGVDAGLLGSLPALLGGGAQTSNLLSVGQGLLGTLFGGNANGIGSALASFAGLKPSSAGSLLGLAAPVVLGFLGRHQAQNGLSAGALANLLVSNKDLVSRALPGSLWSLIGTAPAAVAAPVAAYREPERSRNWVWPIALLAGALLVGLLASRGCSREEPVVATPAPAAIEKAAVAAAQVKLPDGSTIDVLPDSFNYNLATFLEKGTPAELPKTFVFDNLNFDSATTTLTPESLPTLTALASILKAYPAVRAELAGHTDSTGDAAANLQLSLDRANAIRDRLAAAGIDATRLTTAGYGQDRPVADNATDEGRAKNRRTELTVTAK